jgi:TPR repeat protein
MYHSGLGVVEKNETLCVHWLRKSADQGHVSAQFLLGIHYGNGLGVPKDKTIAFSWYKKAAEQGDAVAQYNLACMLEGGIGVERNDIEAYAYFELAASSEQSAAQRLAALKQKISDDACLAGKKRRISLQNEMENRAETLKIQRKELEAEQKKRGMGA